MDLRYPPFETRDISNNPEGISVDVANAFGEYLGKKFIFVTHVMSFVREFADYVIYIDSGKIIEHGKPTILDKPKTIELKEFMAKVR